MPQSSGEVWLRSLDPARRPEARIWMDMSTDEFQGRMALALADLRTEIRDELAEIRDRQSPWRSMGKAIGLFGAGLGAGVFGYWQGR